MATLGERPYSEQDPRRDALMSSRLDREPREPRERSVGALVGELVAETSALVRAELTLARREMQQYAHSAQRGVAAMAAGAVVLNTGLIALVASAILALRRELPDWLAALVVGVIVTAIGGIMLAVGKRKATSEGLKPERTLHSLADMKDMARQEGDRAARKWQ